MSAATDIPENVLFTTLPQELTEVDYIVVGGGTAGSIVASRLSDAHQDASVLVIEAGPESFNTPSVMYPALFRSNLSPASPLLKFSVAAPAPELANRSLAIASGKTLGGGSAVNFMMYARGQRADFDSWGVAGWSAKELLPFFEKAETFYGPDPSSTHGHNGPIAVSSGRYLGPTLSKDYISACSKIGYRTAFDVQDLATGNAAGATYRTVSPTTGRRQDTGYTFLYPRLRFSKCRKLSVLVQTQVLRVLFDETKRATGVEIQGSGTTPQTIRAKKLVVLSAGALGTPQILERSGVGDPKILEKAGVPVVSALPGVGVNYQDHQMITPVYKADLTAKENVDSVAKGIFNSTELIEQNAPILSWNGVDASAKLRPTQAEINAFKPALRKVWDEHFAKDPSKPLAVMASFAGALDSSATYPATERYFTLPIYSAYPRSRGHVHITGPALSDPLDFKTGILADAEGSDIQLLTWIWKKQRQIAKRMTCQRGQASPGPQFPADSLATSDLALDSAKDDPIYSSADDEAIEAWLRKVVSTPFHSVGTCKMAAQAKLGVVDGQLNVYGVSGLKIADLSIAPGITSGNTMNAAVVVGEKAADIINKGA
ncbi:unnamed protein product [Clonostachys rhizophaga]|uniref:Glucose-methanol-choline oxidoreductase N-terminal domain-containing protein n=1 Tax=Clonostachys rhizophaga TaxID=160324 RepID=A0A9N9VQ67_9HYPO|nr:unnamed protein product [Clonostachys rhizophaga]